MSSDYTRSFQRWRPRSAGVTDAVSSALVLDSDWQSVTAIADALQGIMTITDDVAAVNVALMIADPATYPLLDIKRLQRARPDIPLVLCTSERRSVRLFEWFALLKIERTLQKPASADQLETTCRLVTGQTHREMKHRSLSEALLGVLSQVKAAPPDWPHPAAVFRDIQALLSGAYLHGALITRIDRLVAPVLEHHAKQTHGANLHLDAAIDAPDIQCDLPLCRRMLACMLVEGERVGRYSGGLRLQVTAEHNARRICVTAYGKRTSQPPRWPLVETFLQAASEAHGGRYAGVYQGAHLHQQLDLPYLPAEAGTCD